MEKELINGGNMKSTKKPHNNIVYPDNELKIISNANRVSNVANKEDLSQIFHEDIEIKLFYEGSSTLVIGNETIVVNPGDLVMINPFEFHSTVELGEKKGVYYILMIGLDFFEGENTSFLDLRQIFIKERTKISSVISGNERLNSIVTDIVSELQEKKPMYESVVRGLVQQLFSLLIRDFKCEEELELPREKNIRSYELIYPAINKIRSDYAEKISIEELASLCGVCKYHFCRMFKEVTSMSAVSYHTKYRLGVSDVLLSHSEKSISEIATLCGFEDAAYFSRCYKKHFGISPRKKRAILSK